MRRRDVLLLVFAVVAAAVCVRLGVWQLQRLAERRAYNATVLSAYRQPVVPLDELDVGSTVPFYRRVAVTGGFDHGHELVLANRPRRGSPGVHLLTPLLREGTDTAVLVVRGWIYAPDGSRAERGRWREDSARAAAGYVRPYSADSGDATLREGVLRELNHAAVAAVMPYPVAGYVVVLTDTADAGRDVPPRLDEPVLGEGNHLSYAFQWFGFAVVAVAGAVVYVMHAGRMRGSPREQSEQR